MRLSIAYSKEKDIENFLKGQGAIDRPKPTVVEGEFNERFDEFNETNLAVFIEDYTKEEGYSAVGVIEKFKTQWSEVEGEYIKRCEDLFKEKLSLKEMTAYITLNNRCTYNIEGGYFFLSIRAQSAVGTIMHELFHFYTLKAFWETSQEVGLTDLQLNDIKESLTVMLNIEFKDLMGDSVDVGYPQHMEMREQILKLREQHLSVQEIFTKLASDIK